MQTSEIRHQFIEFFKTKQHAFVPSASTIPVNDQTILFTIAGMTQFKACLTGEETRPYKRATNSQKCIRVADLDDVGKDGRHLTMFEMLGSWSFGDYYKKEAIAWAYEFVRDKLKLDLSRLWTTVHHTDDEALEIWKQVGVPAERIVKLGDKDNFWAMGPTGPCGPCSELYYDQGPHVGSCAAKGLKCNGPGCDCDRYLEFWNLVFMQFNRQEDGTLLDLPMKSVDTGSGLERVAALVQGKTTAFDIDVFLSIKKRILEVGGIHKELSALNTEQTLCTNVISDHIRLLTTTLADGANFSNEGRGYVLRRVLRRAVRYVYLLCPHWNKHKAFLAQVVSAVVQEMGDAFPEVAQNKARIENAIATEELRFTSTLELGLQKFNSFLEEARARNSKILSGEHIFILHDSFGFPSDLSTILCEEHGFKADLAGFSELMEMQKERSRQEAQFYKFEQDDTPWVELNSAEQNEDKLFAGYTLTPEVELKAKQIKKVRQLKNNLFELVLARTPFYPEGGGQVADRGAVVSFWEGKKNSFELLGVRKTPAHIVHLLKHEEWSASEAPQLDKTMLKNLFGTQAKVMCHVDSAHRKATARHHTATHLLHKALQVVLGNDVRQAGSLVHAKGLRFDFSYAKAVSAQDLEKIELMVNEEVLKNTAIVTHENIELNTAKKMGAMAMFDEKYDDHVRMLEIPQFSLELCGGTHVKATGEIGLFKITSEGSVTSGVRRIEAVAGLAALDLCKKTKKSVLQTADTLKCAENDIIPKILALKDTQKDLERNLLQLQSQLANSRVDELVKHAQKLTHSVQLIATAEALSSVQEAELLCDRLKQKENTVVALLVTLDGKANVFCAINPNLLKQHKALSAGSIVKTLCEVLEGKGGGRPDFARGGGPAVDKIPQALSKCSEIVAGMLA